MKILHLEDDPADAELVKQFLAREWSDCEVVVVDSRNAFLNALKEKHDVILSDYSLVAFSGMEALQLTRERAPDTPFIFFSGTIREEMAIQAVREGAADYVLKERPLRLITAIKHALAKREEARLRAEAEARIREQKALLDRARDAIVVSDLNDRIVYWNDGAAQILGWSADEIVGRSIDPHLNATTLSKIREVRSYVAAHEEWSGELQVHNKAGREVILDTRVTLVKDDNGRGKARISISTDVTEKNRLKEQFFRAQRLESLGMLAAGIAHDLNNVLAPMIMAPALLRDRMSDPRDTQILELLERSAERGAALVRQILSFAHGAEEIRIVHPKRVLRELATFIAQTFPRSIKVDLSMPSELWAVRASATQLHQVLLNLCINARDAMPRGGELRLIAQNVTLDANAVKLIPRGRPGTWVAIQVEDTGTGIPPEIIERIWEPFFTTKGEGKGTGLGLSTVRGLVENLGGFVALDSVVGRGTCFTVYLPAADANAGGDAPNRAIGTARGNGEPILVVVGDAAVSATITGVLNEAGYTAELAKDGVQAIADFAKRPGDFRLVVTDVQLADASGENLTNMFRQINPALPILAVSGSAAPGELRFADAFLTLPVRSERLLETVARLISASPSPAGSQQR